MKRFWKKYHKWVGLFFTFFILMFCFSGIILNHRYFFSGYDMSRSWMPNGYQYENWNNGVVRGTIKLSNNKVLCYGNAGIWLTDSCFSIFSPLNEGLKEGIDNRKISNITELSDGSVWCAGLYDVYRLSNKGLWEKQTVVHKTERIADIYGREDTLVVMTRSYILKSYPPYERFTRHELKAPTDYKKEVSMFRTIWLLHSGELFGLPGQLVVDCVAIVIIILCITGLIYTFLPKLIRSRSRKKLPVKKQTKFLKYSVKWHNKLGAWLIGLTVLLTVTGMCLRPPLMIPFAITSINPVPGSTMDSDNAWHDKLRSIRWDENLHTWLMSTSAGFYRVDNFTQVPVSIKKAPPISPMGINAFYQDKNNNWLIGSFSGMFRWAITTGKVTDYFTGEPQKRRTFGPPISNIAVAGFSADLAKDTEVVFDYNKGTLTKAEGIVHISDMPEEIKDQPISLWNFALELHVGRCYSPFLGPISDLFVFLAGLLLTFTLISGYIIHKKKKHTNKQS